MTFVPAARDLADWHSTACSAELLDPRPRFSAPPDVTVLLRGGADTPALIELCPGEGKARPAEVLVPAGTADVLCLCRRVGSRGYTIRAGGRVYTIRPELHLAAFLPASLDRQVSGGSTGDALVQVHFPQGWLARLPGRRSLAPQEPRVWAGDRGFCDLMRLLAALRADPVPDRIALTEWTHLVAHRTLELFRAPAQRPHVLAPFRLAAVRDFVEANIGREIALAELAAVARLSLHHFARSFRRETGLPPGAWIEHRRVSEVQRQLRDPALSLHEAGRRAGFTSISAMRAAFRRVTGSTAELARGHAHEH